VSTQPVSVPLPLSSDEIKAGLAKIIAQHFVETLSKTCVLNCAAYGAIRAKWRIEFVLDDFGIPIEGAMSGATGEPFPPEEADAVEGELAEMPPDQFRKRTEQPIPEHRVVKKAQDAGTIIRSTSSSKARDRSRV